MASRSTARTARQSLCTCATVNLRAGSVGAIPARNKASLAYMFPTPASSVWSSNLTLMACCERLSAFAEAFCRKLRSQRLRAQPGQRAAIQREPAEVTGVLEHEVLPAQIENYRRMFGQRVLGRQQIHPPGHAQVAHQGHRFGLSRLPKPEHQVFPPALQTAEPCSTQSLREATRGRRPNHLRATHVDRTNGPAAQQRPQMTDQHFDFW